MTLPSRVPMAPTNVGPFSRFAEVGAARLPQSRATRAPIGGRPVAPSGESDEGGCATPPAPRPRSRAWPVAHWGLNANGGVTRKRRKNEAAPPVPRRSDAPEPTSAPLPLDYTGGGFNAGPIDEMLDNAVPPLVARSWLRGAFTRGERVVIVDVFASFGGATIGVMQAAYAAGATVVGVVALDADEERLGTLRALVSALAADYGQHAPRVETLTEWLGPGSPTGDSPTGLTMRAALAKIRRAVAEMPLHVRVHIHLSPPCNKNSVPCGVAGGEKDRARAAEGRITVSFAEELARQLLLPFETGARAGGRPAAAATAQPTPPPPCTATFTMEEGEKVAEQRKNEPEVVRVFWGTRGETELRELLAAAANKEFKADDGSKNAGELRQLQERARARAKGPTSAWQRVDLGVVFGLASDRDRSLTCSPSITIPDAPLEPPVDASEILAQELALRLRRAAALTGEAKERALSKNYNKYAIVASRSKALATCQQDLAAGSSERTHTVYGGGKPYLAYWDAELGAWATRGAAIREKGRLLGFPPACILALETRIAKRRIGMPSQPRGGWPFVVPPAGGD